MAVKWTEKQQQVIDSRNRNLLVSAAAGSGKTAVLVERIIQMISGGDHPLDIDQLLVMTFTNAAAAEMRERIGAAVEKKLKEHPEDEHLWLQAALIPQAMITTIDSFCLNIIRNHFNSLDIDPSFRIGDEGELSLLRGDVMGGMLEACYEEGDEAFAGFVEHFGRGKSDKGIEDVILQAWQFSQSHPWPSLWLKACRRELDEENLKEMEKSPWMRFLFQDTARQMEELGGQLDTALEVCREENGPLAYEPMLMSDRAKIQAIGTAACEGRYEQLYQRLLNMSFDRLASIRSKEIDGDKKSFVTACRDRVKKAVGKCRELYGSQSPEEVVESIRGTRVVIQKLLELTERFDNEYRAAKKERNVLDFNDLEHLALEVLLEKDPDWEEGEDEGAARRPSPVADELSRQYEEILVDEYQDSNYVQEALITSISRERYGHPNVFMVGDVKQSIYRFRLARPELFMEKYESYASVDGQYQMIELQQNFRSRESVLTSVNDVFYQIMTKNLGGITYTRDTALYPGAVFKDVGPDTVTGMDWEKEGGALSAGTPTELLLVDTGSESLKQLDEDALDYTARELEARMAARRIRELVSGDKGLMVWDKEKEAYRRARLGDIVILLRSMTGWSEVFVNVLMNEGIPASAQTRTGYFNTVEVETILSLLSVIDNPMQDIPLAAVMRSPIVGMSDEEMAWMVAAFKKNSKKGQDRGVYGAWSMWMEAESGTFHKVPGEAAASIRKKLSHLSGLLNGLRREARYLPIHELLYRVYRDSGYYDYVSAMPAGETRRGNLDMLVEKAAAYEATSYKGLFHFVRYIERLKKFDTDFGEAATAGEQDNTVRIMSIHKSKGLEFPVVFLSGMGKRFNKQDAYGRILLDADLGVAADYLDLDLRVKAPTLKKQALKRRMELETMGEELRVLYVAMTRAKEKLIMTATDRSLEAKLAKWQDSLAVDGQIPYTILSSAGSCLDWLLMAKPAIPDDHMQLQCIQVRELVGEEVGRQIVRQMTREDLLAVDRNQVYDREFGERLEAAVNYRYPHMDDTGLYAMVSVSELKKQSQIGRSEDTIGTGNVETEGVGLEYLGKLAGGTGQEYPGQPAGGTGQEYLEQPAGGTGQEYLKQPAGDAWPEQLKQPDAPTQPQKRPAPEVRAVPDSGRIQPGTPSRGALRGTAYHAALEHISFQDIKSLEETEAALETLVEQGYLNQETRGFIRAGDIWAFLESPLGRRMAQAQAEGRIHKEQQFIIGIPARDMGRGDSDELVLIQGIIDAYLEEPDGLVLIDYKTDHVPKENREQGAAMLAARYRVQLDYYERALTQLTGKKVKERVIYSLALQQGIAV
ncbi:helicase-exonuclease AddAB subunit AddA [Lachnoclostridium pacaense]|uniref:helicase-exonuclease AddAB subunit AddA n=1 Tax=Enterocloster hominis (ex Hitch et al. 2024) TaxID=1917870 RepID=UPI001D12FFB2|nr:helicase-exonuclease AddAB subunit AddA [Lachnoclostridium pacaense]MCC2818750.1 helicase-exonuclease AddAB subunit AddA [Lachnoclostridium pacaense]